MTKGRVVAVIAAVIGHTVVHAHDCELAAAVAERRSRRRAPGRDSAAPAPAGPRRVPPSRDSLAKLRAIYVAQVMQPDRRPRESAGRAGIQERASAQGHHGRGARAQDGQGLRRGDELELHELPSTRAAGQLRERHVDRQTSRAVHAADAERHQSRRSCPSSIRRTRRRSRARPVIAATTSRRRATISRPSAGSRARRRKRNLDTREAPNCFLL